MQPSTGQVDPGKWSLPGYCIKRVVRRERLHTHFHVSDRVAKGSKHAQHAAMEAVRWGTPECESLTSSRYYVICNADHILLRQAPKNLVCNSTHPAGV